MVSVPPMVMRADPDCPLRESRTTELSIRVRRAPLASISAEVRLPGVPMEVA
jgi:hypothetical protein